MALFENYIPKNEKEVKSMATLKQAAQSYEPKRTRNIAELEKVSTDFLIFEEKGLNDEGKEYTYNYIEINGERYRVPNSVLEELKEILKIKPDLEFFKVTKSGTGLNTKYKVIQL